MEFNKEEEAKKSLEIAEKKLSENDYNEAKKYLNKAQDLYPELDGLEQVRLMIDVYVSATNKINEEADWYGILCVDPLADDEAVKKQYKKLALLLHPDKNKFNGAEGAVKLVLEAWSLLSDKAKRSAYDQKRKPKQVFNQKKKKTKPREWDSDSESEFEEPNFEPEFKPKYENPWKTGHDEVFRFWTMCKNEKCNIYCTLARAYLSKTVRCPNCRQDFVATEITSKIIDGRRVRSFKTNFQSRSESTSDASSSSSSTTSGSTDDSTNQEQEKEPREKSHGDVVVKVVARSRGNANEEERLFKKMKTGNTRLMTLEAKRREEMKNRLLKEIDAFSSNLSRMRNNK